MKKYKSKIITLLLAAALGSAVFGGVLMLDGGKRRRRLPLRLPVSSRRKIPLR
ncbi:MAG: hypothetical protein ACLS4Z_07185 [Christensenellaceae bacterium]